MDKILYEADQRKRFSVSKDVYSRERLNSLMRVYKELKSEFPSMEIGLSLFGSLSKGKVLDATEESQKSADVDLGVYFKACPLSDDKYFQQLLDKYPKLRMKYEDMKNYIDMARDQGDINVVRYTCFKIFLEDHIKSKLPYKMNMFLGHTDKFDGLNNVYEIIFASVASGRVSSRLTAEYTAFFALDVGGGMKQYRKEFLTTLLKNYKRIDAERMWKDLIQYIYLVERNFKSDISINKFPKDIEAACKAYGVKM
jgi:hypothetical protein